MSESKPLSQSKAAAPKATPEPKAPSLKVNDPVRFVDRDGEIQNALVARVWQNGTVNLTYLQSPTQPQKGGTVVTVPHVPLENLR